MNKIVFIVCFFLFLGSSWLFAETNSTEQLQKELELTYKLKNMESDIQFLNRQLEENRRIYTTQISDLTTKNSELEHLYYYVQIFGAIITATSIVVGIILTFLGFRGKKGIDEAIKSIKEDKDNAINEIKNMFKSSTADIKPMIESTAIEAVDKKITELIKLADIRNAEGSHNNIGEPHDENPKNDNPF